MKWWRAFWSGFDTRGILISLAFFALLGWSVTTHSKLLSIIMGIMYLLWLVVGSAVVTWRRWQAGSHDAKR